MIMTNNNTMWAGVQIMKLLLCNFLQYPVTFSLLGSHIFHSTLFPHTLSGPRFSHNVGDQTSQTNTTANTMDFEMNL